MSDDIILYELAEIIMLDVTSGNYFNLFGEVVSANNGIFVFFLGERQLTKNV